MLSTAGAGTHCVRSPSHLLLKPFWAAMAMHCRSGWFGELLHAAVAAQNGSEGKWEELLTQHIAAPALLTVLPLL